jgi:hypothetical protein
MNGVSGTLVQAIRGPLLLTILGILFAVAQSGGYSVWRTWPVLLIVYGALKLLERMPRRPKAEPGPWTMTGGAQ